MKPLVFIFFLLMQTTLSAQTISFDVYMFGDKIGTMSISRTVHADGSEVYVMHTKSKAKVLWIERSNETRYDVVYKDGKLVSSNVKEVEDGKVKRWVQVKWDGAKYNVEGYKGKRSFTQVPSMSVVTIFF